MNIEDKTPEEPEEPGAEGAEPGPEAPGGEVPGAEPEAEAAGGEAADAEVPGAEPGPEAPTAEGPQAPAGDEPTREAPTEPLGAGAGAAGAGAPGAEPRRLYRSRSDRVIAGVCGGLARYFRIDPVIVRVVAVALVFLGGAGVLLYLAAVLMVPDEDGVMVANTGSLRGRLLTGLAAVLLAVAFLSIFPWGWGWNDWFLPGLLVPLAVVALLGLGVRWFFPPDRERTGNAGDVLRRVVLAACLLIGCLLLAIGAAWAGAIGAGGVVAAVVIAAGVMLVAGAFVARMRWLILPALSIAVPLAIVSAAGIDVDNSIGDRQYRPASVNQLRNHYELGLGHLVVDLRDADIPSGVHRVSMELGVGEAILVVPEDVCVSSAAKVGMGGVDVFNSGEGGIDVDWDDRQLAPGDTPTIVVDADVGVGAFEVQHQLDSEFHDFGRFDPVEDDAANSRACRGVGSA
jgi:phage shock protein PspC (stress-responsive transcriptional regulator)